MNTIYLWCDGTWRYSEEYSDVYDSWKSDDYSIVDIPEEMTYDEIDDWCFEITKGNFK